MCMCQSEHTRKRFVRCAIRGNDVDDDDDEDDDDDDVDWLQYLSTTVCGELVGDGYRRRRVAGSCNSVMQRNMINRTTCVVRCKL